MSVGFNPSPRDCGMRSVLVVPLRPGDRRKGDRYRRMMLRQPTEQEKRRECKQLKQVGFLQQLSNFGRPFAALRYARMPFRRPRPADRRFPVYFFR